MLFLIYCKVVWWSFNHFVKLLPRLCFVKAFLHQLHHKSGYAKSWHCDCWWPLTGWSVYEIWPVCWSLSAARHLDLWTMEEAATTEGKEIEVFTAKQEHQRILGNPSDPSCKKRHKRRVEFLPQISKDLETVWCFQFHIKNSSDWRPPCSPL